MKLFFKIPILLVGCLFAASGFVVSAQSSVSLLGIKLRPEIQEIIEEIEKKTGKKIYAEWVRHKDFMFGSSFVSDDGVPVVLVDFNLENNPQKLEAVLAHELLHLRLRANGFPVFLFSAKIKTARGLAQDVEQPNVNDLTSLIEHRIFKPEMEKLGLSKIINLAGDTARSAKAQKGALDGQADSINYARAILEYQNPQDVEEVRKIYQTNGWKRALADGKQIADIISRSKLQTPKDVEAVFLQCLLKLYPLPPAYSFNLTVEPNTKNFRRMIINAGRRTNPKIKRSG